jgi:hypothetical protein
LVGRGNSAEDVIETAMLVAALSAVLYYLGCRLIGEHFPFSRFNLYSNTAHREKSAAPVFFADGEAARIWDFERFSGFEPDDFLPARMPTGLSWVAHEAGRWVREHTAEGQAGPVEVAYGFRLFSVGDDGKVREEIEILQRGTAWPK